MANNSYLIHDIQQYYLFHGSATFMLLLIVCICAYLSYHNRYHINAYLLGITCLSGIGLFGQLFFMGILCDNGIYLSLYNRILMLSALLVFLLFLFEIYQTYKFPN